MFKVKLAMENTKKYIFLALAGCCFLAAPTLISGPPKLVWNASASVPKGFYRIESASIKSGDLVLVHLPDWVQSFAAKRGYLPKNTPAIKRISAVHGDVVCRFDSVVFINQNHAAIAKTTDKSGRKMPCWTGCRVLGMGDIFLLADHPDSFDGRYFGLIKASSIIGVAKPVWFAPDKG